MDECLPLGSLDASTLRMLLEKERVRRAEWEQDAARLQAVLERQNAVIIQLERRDTERERDLQAMHTLVAGLTEQHALLRRQLALLQQEHARLHGMPLAPPPEPTAAIKPATPRREQQPRKKRAPDHNRGRLKLERANRWETHAAEQCPRCGEELTGGWIQRRIQVLELPPVAPVEVTEHRIIRRQCSRCGTRVLPAPVGLEAGRIGRCRFGPRLIAAIATMATVERLPGRVIQERLEREYGLTISHGGICGLLQRMAKAGTPAYEQVQQDSRGSPVIYADETGWRQDGQHTTIWTVTSAHTVYVHHGRRTKEEIDGILGDDFGGTIVSDCDAAYDHFVGRKQRCWAHVLRDLESLLAEHGHDLDTVAWVEGIRWIFAQARAPRSTAEEGGSYQAVRARKQRADRCEALILLLCPAEPDPHLPSTARALRLRKHLAELFTFVRDPEVEATNNIAERSLRPLVIARKVSGETRSEAGSATRMTLYSLAATAKLQGKDPMAIYQQLLLVPPGAPSPLAAPLRRAAPPTAQSHAI